MLFNNATISSELSRLLLTESMHKIHTGCIFFLLTSISEYKEIIYLSSASIFLRESILLSDSIS